MKAIAFRSKVKPDGTIVVPKKVRRSVKGEEVRVVLLWPESEEDASLWEQAGIGTFLEGDGQYDALYDTPASPHREYATRPMYPCQVGKLRV